MKAIHLTGYGNPAQNLQMVEVPEAAAPSAGEALVRLEYAPVDYSDLLLRPQRERQARPEGKRRQEHLGNPRKEGQDEHK